MADVQKGIAPFFETFINARRAAVAADSPAAEEAEAHNRSPVVQAEAADNSLAAVAPDGAAVPPPRKR